MDDDLGAARECLDTRHAPARRAVCEVPAVVVQGLDGALLAHGWVDVDQAALLSSMPVRAVARDEPAIMRCIVCGSEANVLML